MTPDQITVNAQRKAIELRLKEILEYFGYVCPLCKKGLITRESKNGFLFIGCLGFPKCRFTSLERKSTLTKANKDS